jgi:hypothetical protein
MSAKAAPVDSIVVLDSTGHAYSVISSALLKCHQAWFHLDEWHRAFMLVCDDAAIHRFSKEMSTLFCISSDIFASQHVEKITKNIQHRATILRWFGLIKTPTIIKKIARLKLLIAKLSKSTENENL